MKIKHTILVGEPMGLFIADELGKLEDVNHFSFTTCGAELNVAIGMKRLGHDVSYMTKLGNDPFGARIVNRIKELGISTDLIQFSLNIQRVSCLNPWLLTATPVFFTSAREAPPRRSMRRMWLLWISPPIALYT